MRISIKKAMAMRPYELAKKLGIHYSGDVNPFNHGGMFFESKNWPVYGYAECVEFYQVGNVTNVCCATINKLEGDDLLSALCCASVPDECHNNIEAIIYACYSYAGCELVEDFDGVHHESFDECQEFKAWNCALPHILNLRLE